MNYLNNVYFVLGIVSWINELINDKYDYIMIWVHPCVSVAAVTSEMFLWVVYMNPVHIIHSHAWFIWHPCFLVLFHQNVMWTDPASCHVKIFYLRIELLFQILHVTCSLYKSYFVVPSCFIVINNVNIEKKAVMRDLSDCRCFALRRNCRRVSVVSFILSESFIIIISLMSELCKKP